MSQPYPPPYPSQQPSSYPQPGWSDPRTPVPEETHLGSWAPPPAAAPPPAGFGPHGPYGGYPPQGPPPGNGAGVTALVLALVGLLLSWIPFVGLLSILLGVIAVVFGLVGWNRARHGRATLALPVTGAALAIVAIVVGIISTSYGVQLVDRFAEPVAAPPGRTAVPPVSDPSTSDPGLSAPPADATGTTVALPGSFAWDDGVSIEVGAPQRVTFSSTASAGGAAGVAFPVRIVNGSSEVLEPFSLLTSLTADGAPAERVFDYESDFTAPTNSIPPGRELAYTMAFDAPGGDLLLEFSSFDRESAFFTAIG